MTVGILGAGALGQLLAHALSEQGYEVSLLRRPGQPRVLRSHQLFSLSDAEHHHDFAHCGSDQPQRLSAVLVLTKAQDCLSALTPLLAWLPEDVPLVLLHNGLGPQQAAAKRWPERPWWAGSLTDGALKLDAHSVRHTGQGQRRAGPLSGVAADTPLPDTLVKLGFHFDGQILDALWQKLTVNLLINPLTARERVCNGALLAEGYRGELVALSEEIALVGQSLGQKEPAHVILERALGVAEATAANHSSMLQDVQAGRPTELEAITGYLLERAGEHNLPCPNHQRLYQQLQPRT